MSLEEEFFSLRRWLLNQPEWIRIVLVGSILFLINFPIIDSPGSIFHDLERALGSLGTPDAFNTPFVLDPLINFAILVVINLHFLSLIAKSTRAVRVIIRINWIVHLFILGLLLYGRSGPSYLSSNPFYANYYWNFWLEDRGRIPRLVLIDLGSVALAWYFARSLVRERIGLALTTSVTWLVGGSFVTERLQYLSWLVLGAVGLLALVVGSLFVFPDRLVRRDLGSRVDLEPSELAKAKNDVRTTLIQGIGGALLLLGAFFTWRQLQVSQQQLLMTQRQQVTERFSRAIDQLGNKNPDVQQGGIATLERTANDSPDDSVQIGGILNAFVRRNSPSSERTRAKIAPTLQPMRIRAPTIQAALLAIQRIQDRAEGDLTIDLRDTDLRKAELSAEFIEVSLGDVLLNNTDLREAELDGLELRSTSDNIENVTFAGASLESSELDLSETYLNNVSFANAQLQGSIIKLQGSEWSSTPHHNVTFAGADLHYSNLSGDFRGVDLRGADLQGADLSETSLDGAKLSKAKADGDTSWPDGFTSKKRAAAGVITS